MSESTTSQLRSDDAFVYDSALSSSEFRLIKFLPVKENAEDPLELRILTFPLDHPPEPYYALSYTWGPAEYSPAPPEQPFEPRYITLNDHVFQVGQNLHDALFHLRVNFPHAWLWIDAICINQDDLNERASQVSLMDVIYTNALGTIAWLGKSSPGLPRALAIMCQVSVALRDAGILIAVASEDQSLGLQRDLGNWLSPEDWGSMGQVFTRRWFSRLWIFQEIVLAREITFLWGITLIPWRVVADFASLSYQSGSMNRLFLQLEANSTAESPLEQMRQAVANVALVERARLWFGCHGIIDIAEYPRLSLEIVAPKESPEDLLLYLLFSTPNPGMSDKRDRFYGLFGILNKSLKHKGLGASWAKVDYEEPVADVFTRMTSAILLHDGRLDVVCFGGKLLAKIEGVPSWVSEWNCARFPSNYPTPLHRQDASNSHELKTVIFRIRGPKLYCRGMKVGSVVRLAAQHGYLNFTSGNLQTLAAITSSLPLVYPHTDQPRVEAVCRTLLLDKYTTHTRMGDDTDVFEGLRGPFREWAMRVLFESEVGHVAAGKAWETVMEEYRAFDEVAASDETGIFPSTGDIMQRFEMLRRPDAMGDELESAAARQLQLLNEWQAEAQKWLERLVQPSLRRLAVLEGCYLANLPDGVDEGDEVWVVQGCHLPLVMRRPDGGEDWVVMGDAYVHGIMSGEAIGEDVRWEDMCIV